MCWCSCEGYSMIPDRRRAKPLYTSASLSRRLKTYVPKRSRETATAVPVEHGPPGPHRGTPGDRRRARWLARARPLQSRGRAKSESTRPVVRTGPRARRGCFTIHGTGVGRFGASKDRCVHDLWHNHVCISHFDGQMRQCRSARRTHLSGLIGGLLLWCVVVVCDCLFAGSSAAITNASAIRV